MLNKKDKKLSEQDLENWNRLKKTLDFKFYKKSYRITDLEKTNQFHKDNENVKNYNFSHYVLTIDSSSLVTLYFNGSSVSTAQGSGNLQNVERLD